MSEFLLEIRKKLESENPLTSEDAIYEHARTSIIQIEKTIAQLKNQRSFQESVFWDLANGELEICEEERSNEILVDDSIWKDAFLQIAKGEWTLRQSPSTAHSYSATLISCYYKLLQESSAPLDELLPLLLIADAAKAELFYFCGLIVGIGDTPRKEAETRLRKRRSIKKSKIDKKWLWAIGVIEKLNEEGAFKECKSLGRIAQIARDSMVIERREDKKNKKGEGEKDTHPWSIDTIKKIFNDVFGITTKNFKQPLTLRRKV